MGCCAALLLPDVEWTAAALDPRVIAVTVLLALVAGLITGLAPMRQLSRADVVSDLRTGGRGVSLRGSRLRRGLLVLQGAISVVLLIGAGLFVRSFHNVRSLDLGFQPEHVIVAELSARGTPIDSARRIELMERLRERALTVPGVQHAAHTLTIPFSLEWNQYLFVPGIDTASLRDLFYINPVGPGYFETMGTPLIRGRADHGCRSGRRPARRGAEPGRRSQDLAVGGPVRQVREARGQWSVLRRRGDFGRHPRRLRRRARPPRVRRGDAGTDAGLAAVHSHAR